MTDLHTNQLPEPSLELVADIRKRLAGIPQDVLDRAHHALLHEPINYAGSILYKAGLCLTSHELYEYRKALFPPDALVDPLTPGAPILHNAGSISASASPDSRTVRQATPVSGSVLLSELRDLIKRYVVLPEMGAETLALWVVHTYAFTLREVTTYIGVVSPEKRCGKTTLLELLGRLAHDSVAASNISPSALFKVIEEASPTLLIDEADTFLQGRDELAGILNAGYRKDNAYVVRVAEGKTRPKPPGKTQADRIGDPCTSSLHGRGKPERTSSLVRYSCWCPKVMAAIGRLPDTLADRCIVITMQRKMPGEKCERLRRLNPAEFRERCDRFVHQHSEAIAGAQPAMPAALNDRAADIWEPLFAIADLAGDDWPELARQAALKLSSTDDEMTLIGYFLADIRTLMLNSKVDRVLNRDLIRVLNPLHNRPWEDLRRGREINEYWLAGKMKELGMRSRNIRVGDAVGKGYMLDEVEAAFRRYVPNAPGEKLEVENKGGGE